MKVLFINNFPITTQNHKEICIWIYEKFAEYTSLSNWLLYLITVRLINFECCPPRNAVTTASIKHSWTALFIPNTGKTAIDCYIYKQARAADAFSHCHKLTMNNVLVSCCSATLDFSSAFRLPRPDTPDMVITNTGDPTWLLNFLTTGHSSLKHVCF